MSLQAQAVLSPKQLLAIADADGRVNLWEGSIRSGKTFSSLLAWLAFVANAPLTGELVMIGNSKHSIYRNLFAPIENAPEYAFIREGIRYRAGGEYAYIFGRRVHVLGANDSRSEQKVRGMTVVGAYIDELTIINHDFFKQVLGRMSATGARLYATTNPDSPAHWLKAEYLDHLRELPDWRVFHFTLDDNVALDPAYVRSIKREYSGLWYKRFILGLWVAAEGAIYNMWDPERHVVRWRDLPTIRNMVAVGMDYGTTNASTGLMLGVTRELVDGHYRSRLALVDEWRYDSRAHGGMTKTDVELSHLYRTWLETPHLPEGNPGNAYRPRFHVVDPSAASFSAQLRKDGIVSAPAKNDVAYGIRLIASLLGEGRLIVSDRCEGFITEAPGYAWDAKRSQQGEDAPVKVADHSLDGARYAIATTEQVWGPMVDWPALDPVASGGGFR